MPQKACELHMVCGAFQGTNCITCFVKFWILKLILLCQQNCFPLKDSGRCLARFVGEFTHLMAFWFFPDIPKNSKNFILDSFSVWYLLDTFSTGFCETKKVAWMFLALISLLVWDDKMLGHHLPIDFSPVSWITTDLNQMIWPQLPPTQVSSEHSYLPTLSVTIISTLVPLIGWKFFQEASGIFQQAQRMMIPSPML